ncbi:MAG: DUF167 domain-containing protein [Pseudomonadota bacterium]|nr:DUF167 domain-containing protein [Pseudomonadota bacterium]
MTSWLRSVDDGVEITVHIQPGAAHSELAGKYGAGEHGEALKVRISARAVEGAANAALTEFMAQCLGVARREVRIVRGEKSRHKVLWAPVAPELARRQIEGNTK